MITMGFGVPNRILVYGLNTNEVLLFYNAEEHVELPVPEEYVEARKVIFGEGGFLKDHAPIKASEMITLKKRAKYYVKPTEIFKDVIDNVFPSKTQRFMRGVLKDATITLITNAFQEMSQDNLDAVKDIVNDLNLTLYGYIQRTRREDRNSYFEVNVLKENEGGVYSVSVSLLKTE